MAKQRWALAGLLAAGVFAVGFATPSDAAGSAGGTPDLNPLLASALRQVAADVPASSSGDVNVIVVLDTSGSMSEDDGTGTIKLDGARHAFVNFVNSAPPGVRIGLRTFPTLGTDCGAGDLLVPVGSMADPDALAASLYAHGRTPTGSALLAAADDLPAGGTNFIVLISDGLSNCDPPPCPVAQEIAERGIDVTINTIGFQISEDGAAELECIADAGGGSYVDVSESDELQDQLEDALLPRLTITADYPTQVASTDRGLEPNPIVIKAGVKNTGMNTATGVLASITFTTTRNPGLVDPVRLLGNLPPGTSSAEFRWIFAPEPSLEPYTVGFEIRATSPTTPEAAVRTGSITVGAADPRSLLALVENGAPVAIIGDSYSAGEGAPAYDEGTDEAELPGNTCHRGQTYGRADLPAEQLDLLACSGAIAVDLIAPVQIDLPEPLADCWMAEGYCPWDLEEVEDTLPAQIEQLADLDQRPALVLLTIGGNDMGFGLVAAHCYAADDGCQDLVLVKPCLSHPIDGCTAVYEDSDKEINQIAEAFVDLRLAALPGTLVDVLRVVDAAVNGDIEGEAATQFVVLGYPSPLPGSHQAASGGCIAQYDDTELDWLGDVQWDLNEAVATAVQALQAEGRPFQWAESPMLAFAGHTACDTEPYANGIVGLGRVESLHPNNDGYVAMWDALRQDLAAMYPIERNVSDPTDWADFACDSRHVEAGEVVVMGEESVRVEVGGCYVVASRGWEQRSVVEFYLMSAPRLVGQATADAAGNAVAMVWIPPSVEAGTHQLVAMGVDADGVVATVAMPVEADVQRRFPTWLPPTIAGCGGGLLIVGIALAAIPARKRARR